ncbi:MAG: four helix bundle protein [Chloroflexota bacterium]
MSDEYRSAGTKIQRFEDFVAWQQARRLTAEVYRVTAHGRLARDYALVSQRRHAAVSIMSNIAEGFERDKAGEFYQFLSVAKASCAELRSQLYVAQDVGFINQDQFDTLLAQAEEVGRVTGGLRAAAERRRAAPPLITHHS